MRISTSIQERQTILKKWLCDAGRSKEHKITAVMAGDGLLVFQSEDRDFILLTEGEEREAAKQRILEDVHLIADAKFIKHSTFLNAADSGSLEIITALKEAEGLFNQGLIKMIDDIDLFVDDLIAENGTAYYIGNEECYRHDCDGLVLFESVIK